MIVNRDENGDAVITMTFDELGIVRYALAEGVDKLVMSAIYHKSMKLDSYESAKKTADNAKSTAAALEEATLKWAKS